MPDRCDHCGDYLTDERWSDITGELCQACWEAVTGSEWWDMVQQLPYDESEASDE